MSLPYRVSVVIPTYQRSASVERALRSLFRQTVSPAEYEVVVSIDGSRDGTAEMVARLHAPCAVRSISQPKRGRAGACNSGIREARGELIVLLDDDMEAAPELLEAHLGAHAADPRLGVLGAVPVVAEPGSPPVVEYIADRFRRHMEKLSIPGHPIGVRDFYTGNFSMRRDTFFEAGLFDEGFQSYGNEDVELAIRLAAANIRLAFCPGAIARQHYEKDFGALARDKMAQGRTSVVCAARHPETIPSLRIGTYRQGGRKWRALRSLLVAASRLLPILPRAIVRYVSWLERRRASDLRSRYDLVLDYFFWLGVRSALRDGPASVRGLVLWTRAAEEGRS